MSECTDAESAPARDELGVRSRGGVGVSGGDGEMVVVAGHFRVPSGRRHAAVAGYRALTEAARRAPGCIALTIAPDPIDPERVDVCEIWASERQLAGWRRQAPPPDLPEDVGILDIQMWEYVVATRREPFSGAHDR